MNYKYTQHETNEHNMVRKKLMVYIKFNNH